MNAPALDRPSALRPERIRRWIAPAATIFLLAAIAVSAVAPVRGATAASTGGTIVFASERSGNFQIYSVHADGSRLGQLTRNHASDTAPVFSPDGRRIVFARATRCCSALWLMNADGSGQRQFAPYSSAPAWSPDSQRIAYVGFGKGDANPEPLLVAGVDGRRRFVIRGTTRHPSWSPDGRWIAFAREVGDRTDLVVVGSDGGRPRTLRRNVDYNGPLGWTRRGEVLTTTPSRGIYLIRADRRGVRRLPRIPETYFDALTLSPDGRSVAWIARHGHLRIRALGGGRSRDITPRGTEQVDSPAWSADGRSIAVASFPRGGINEDIVVVAASGTSSRRLTRRVPYPYGSENQQPNWRPRGASRALKVWSSRRRNDHLARGRRSPRGNGDRPPWLRKRRGLGREAGPSDSAQATVRAWGISEHPGRHIRSRPRRDASCLDSPSRREHRRDVRGHGDVRAPDPGLPRRGFLRPRGHRDQCRGSLRRRHLACFHARQAVRRLCGRERKPRGPVSAGEEDR